MHANKYVLEAIIWLSCDIMRLIKVKKQYGGRGDLAGRGFDLTPPNPPSPPSPGYAPGRYPLNAVTRSTSCHAVWLSDDQSTYISQRKSLVDLGQDLGNPDQDLEHLAQDSRFLAISYPRIL